ncbi:tripartite tricarboxylate transporter TctB family protein [Roseibium aggregatum]|uniref:tripartite tricarboxylate transporter TctB family protein n=1 Tax=Roseibium aggregatum TaxID=187304 RepID=UPI00339D52B4
MLVLLVGTMLVVTSFNYAALPGQAYGGGTMPRLIGTGGILLGLYLVVTSQFKGKVVSFPSEGNGRADWLKDRRKFAVLAVLGSVIFYMLASPVAGFLPTVVVMTGTLMLLLGVKVLTTVTISFVTAFVTYFGFSHLLLVPLPRGPIENLLW